jgi:L-aminopeptidase/D-esterase-like protein
MRSLCARRARADHARERPAEEDHMLTTQQHYEVAGGTLKVILTTDHALSGAEQRRLAGVGDACLAFQAGAPPVPAAPDLDEAIWELGGEEAICAG